MFYHNGRAGVVVVTHVVHLVCPVGQDQRSKATKTIVKVDFSLMFNFLSFFVCGYDCGHLNGLRLHISRI